MLSFLLFSYYKSIFWVPLIVYKHYCFKPLLHSFLLITSSVEIWNLAFPDISFYWKRFDRGKCKKCNIRFFQNRIRIFFESSKFTATQKFTSFVFWVTPYYNVGNLTEIFFIILLFYHTIFVIVCTYLQEEILMGKEVSQLLYLSHLCWTTVGRMSFC